MYTEDPSYVLLQCCPMHMLPHEETLKLFPHLNMHAQCFLLLQKVSGEVSPFFFSGPMQTVTLSPTRSLTTTHIFHIKLSWNNSGKHISFV
ncbi:hypothetical protein SEVIR_5G378050v4 [Setaria viridis]